MTDQLHSTYQHPVPHPHFFQSLIAIIVVIVMVLGSFARNNLWHTKLTLWTDTAQKSPNKARVLSGLGLSYWLNGQYDDAAIVFKKALELDNSYLEAYDSLYILCTEFDRHSNYNQAITCYQSLCNSAPPIFHKRKDFSCNRLTELISGKK